VPILSIGSARLLQRQQLVPNGFSNTHANTNKKVAPAR